jgi:poly(hydroxyalkanoate) granule-associated protein
MANTRKTTKTPNDDAATSAEAGEQAARLSRSLSGTAQQIWLAGIGALARAQTESTKLFEGLVKEGLTIEQSAMKFADAQAHVIRNAVESGVDTAAARAAGTWDQLESAVEGGVRRALVRLGVPDREELAELSRRVESLSAELRKRGGGAKAATGQPAQARKAAKRAPAKTAAAARPGTKAVKKSAKKAAKAPTPR